METVLMDMILKALVGGDIRGFIGFVAIFTLLWIQVRGMKKAIEALNTTLLENKKAIEDSFAAGEKRMEKIEIIQLKFEHRLTELEVLRTKEVPI